MTSHFRQICAAALFSCLASSAFAASACYEDVLVPASMNCDASKSKSADFVTGCSPVSAHYEKVEVECQPTWVNVTHNISDQSHAEVCATEDMKPSNIDGQRCASGERHAEGGLGTVTYRFGKANTSANGGTMIVKVATRIGDPGGDSTTWISAGPDNYFCYGNGQKQDMDRTDLVAAYACK